MTLSIFGSCLEFEKNLYEANSANSQSQYVTEEAEL